MKCPDLFGLKCRKGKESKFIRRYKINKQIIIVYICISRINSASLGGDRKEVIATKTKKPTTAQQS